MTIYVKFGENNHSIEILRAPADDFDATGYEILPEGFEPQGIVIKEANGTIRNRTEAEIKAIDDAAKAAFELQIAKMKAKAEGSNYVLNGETYKIPLTADTQNAVVAVTLAFQQAAITSTVLKLENGTVMPINATEWTPFATWFAVERNKLFV